jgi:hypothetical protein
MHQNVDKFGAYAISASLAAIVKLTAHFKRLNSIWKTTKAANRPRRVSDHLTTTYFELYVLNPHFLACDEPVCVQINPLRLGPMQPMIPSGMVFTWVHTGDPYS